MQSSDRISLNGIRIFAVAADCGSLKLAAARLGVTPGAVSRQIQSLEAAMGVPLFHRTNNAIQLTDVGDDFLRHVLPGLNILKRATDGAMGDGRDVSVRVPTTLATRWLIPMLDKFRTRWPDIAIRVETHGGTGMQLGARADVTLAYYPVAALPQGAEIFLDDRCRPYLSPRLLDALSDVGDLSAVPALQCAAGNWDWTTWLEQSGKSDVQLSYGGYFDLDDAALRAAIAGLGMVLAPEFIIRDDLEAGRLCPLPNAPEVLLGHYALHTERPVTSTTDLFARWLRQAR